MIPAVRSALLVLPFASALKINRISQAPDPCAITWDTATCKLPVAAACPTCSATRTQDTRTANSQALCKAGCEASWRQSILDGGFNTGTNSYQSSLFGFPGQMSRGCCAYNAGTDECTAHWMSDINQDIEEGEDQYGIFAEFQIANADLSAFILTESCANPTLGGDPHVTNVKGQSFDILKAGTFSVLSFHSSNWFQNTLLDAKIFISRVNEKCSEAYIQNLTLSGDWVKNMGHNLVQIGASYSSIEVGFDGKWQSAKHIKSKRFSAYDDKTLLIELEQNLTITVDILGHGWKLEDDGWKYKKINSDAQENVHKLGWSFLNLRFNGVEQLIKNVHGINYKGLLVDDDYREVSIPPPECKSFAKESVATRARLQSSLEVN